MCLWCPSYRKPVVQTWLSLLIDYVLYLSNVHYILFDSSRRSSLTLVRRIGGVFRPLRPGPLGSAQYQLTLDNIDDLALINHCERCVDRQSQ